MSVGVDFCGGGLGVFGPGVEPEKAVGAVAYLGLVAEDFVALHEFGLGLVDEVVVVAVEEGAVGLLEGGDVGGAGLPGGGGTEEEGVPVVVGEGFAIVIPGGGEDAGGVLAVAFCDELLDVDEGVVEVGPDGGPVVDAGGDPGLDAGLGVGGEERGEAVFWVGGCTTRLRRWSFA